MIVYIVQYHSNAWADQMASDGICGVYSTEEAANKRAEEFRKKYAVYDDIVSVDEYELDKKYAGCIDEMYDNQYFSNNEET